MCYCCSMSKPRGKEHTTLTETAAAVVKELTKISGIKMIAPGQISTTSRKKSGKRFITLVETTAGLELIITGQSVQNVAVHTDNIKAVTIGLRSAKSLREFTFSERKRLPEI